MKKKGQCIRKAAFGLLVVLFGMVLGTGLFFEAKGYVMYQKAAAEKPIGERIEEIRSMEHFVSYSDLPQFYIKATISIEDHRFERHGGIDLIAIARAAWMDLKAMAFVQGGSTITQQLAKNMLFTQEKRIERKVAEIFAALEMEANNTKEEIFELYANTAYFGSGYYGIYQAAKGYFGKEPSELDDYESAMLAGIPNAPGVYSPDVNPELASERLHRVLSSMVKHKMLTQKEADKIEK